MAIAPGTECYGLPKDLYDEIKNFSPPGNWTESGDYMLYDGDWQEYFDFLIDNLIDEDTFGLHLYEYLYSSWVPKQF